MREFFPRLVTSARSSSLCLRKSTVMSTACVTSPAELRELSTLKTCMGFVRAFSMSPICSATTLSMKVVLAPLSSNAGITWDSLDLETIPKSMRFYLSWLICWV